MGRWGSCAEPSSASVNGACSAEGPPAVIDLLQSLRYSPSVDDDDRDDDIDDIEEEIDLPPLTQAAVALHEVFLALVEGGFDDYDAIRLVAQLIIEQGIGDQGSGE